MYYGIDLGTTNSLIGTGDTLYTGLVSSSVDISTKSQVPRDVVGDNIVSSYKVNMTTGKEGQLSIACSSVILKELTKQASMRSGEDVKDIVVSVPAKFTHTQRQAVYDAIKMAGLNAKGLINEPTAAALYVCRDIKDLLVVYDLGGGTFDVTVIDSRAGSYYVVATDGRILAGDDFDRALSRLAFDEMKVKIRFQSEANTKKMIVTMRQAKERLQREGMTQFIDMTPYGVNAEFELTVEKYTTVMKRVFAETVSLTKYVINSSLDYLEKPKIVFVGGSTACPYLRKWVQEETGLTAVDGDSTPPDLIVAKGVALYAEMLYNGTADAEVEDVTKRLCIEDDKGGSITLIEKNTIIPIVETQTVVNPHRCDKLEINLYQGDSILCSNNDYIGTLVYDYGEMKEPEEGIVEIEISVDRNGIISLKGIDLLTSREQIISLSMR